MLFIKFPSINVRKLDDPISNINGILRTSFSEAYMKHPYIYKKLLVEELRKYSNKLSEYRHETIKNLRDKIQVRRGVISKDLTVFEGYWQEDANLSLTKSLKILIEYIFEYFRERVYVLIDEFDAPMNSSIGKEHYQYVESLMKEIFSLALKNNKKRKKTIMIGILTFN